MSSESPGAGVRVLFVHAHPDDESITTGGTMAQLVRAGAHVTLLTASRGEGGEVIGELRARLEGNRTALAAHREGELDAAMRALGVRDHRFLTRDSGGRYEDSGMQWGADGHAVAPADMPGAALCRAELAEVTARIAQAVAEVRPNIVITYAADGGYGHPDHRRVHEATVAALESLRGRIDPTLLFIEMPAEVAAAAVDPEQPGFDLTGFEVAPVPSQFPAQAPIAVAQDVSDVIGEKAMAMAAHATQITVAGGFFALSNKLGQAIGTIEYFSNAAYPGPEPMPGAPYASVLDVAAADAAVSGGAADASAPGRLTPVGAEAADTAGTAAAVTPTEGDDMSTTHETEPSPRISNAAPRRPGVLGVLHAVLLGVLVAFLGTMQHLNASVVNLGGQQIIVPWGLLIALALATASMWHIAALYRSTMLLVLLAIVICLGAFLLGQPSLLPGHDLLLVNNARSLCWLFGPMVIAAVLAFALPQLKRRSS